mgnify:CR=1 FL=1
MKLIIDIPEETYATLNSIPMGNISVSEILYSVKNGTPLPKGHGRLIDADAFSGDMFCNTDLTDVSTCYNSIRKMLEDTPTIIIGA